VQAKPNDYGKLATASPLQAPNPACPACETAIAHVATDTAKFTLQALVADVVKRDLGIARPTLVTSSNFLYEDFPEDEQDEDEEAAEMAAMLPVALAALPGGGLTHNTTVEITDDDSDLRVRLIISHQVWRLPLDATTVGLCVRGQFGVRGAH
jgi:Ubiquitin/SUMO-activating enzyme ubiquitin-like domain